MYNNLVVGKPNYVVPDIYSCWLFSMFYRCTADGKYQQTIGMAIECRRLDKLEEAVISSDNVHSTINYCIDICHSFVNRREYRCEVTSFSIFRKIFCRPILFGRNLAFSF